MDRPGEAEKGTVGRSDRPNLPGDIVVLSISNGVEFPWDFSVIDAATFVSPDAGKQAPMHLCCIFFISGQFRGQCGIFHARADDDQNAGKQSRDDNPR